MVKAKKATLPELLTGETPLFPMAKTPTYYRRVVNPEGKKFRKKVEAPPKFAQLAGYMSESSDEEGPAKKKPKKKVWKKKES